MKRIVVFCGSSSGTNDVYMKAAGELGKHLAQSGIGLVYGGAKVGLMGAVAGGALAAGGEVTGVIPEFLTMKEIVHGKLTKLIKVKTMHDRKSTIYDLSDGAIILPGGFGTLDEMFELLTWGQLGLHGKPVGVLNIENYFSYLLSFVDRMVSEGFLKDVNRDMLLVSDKIEPLLNKMKAYNAPGDAKWIKINNAIR